MATQISATKNEANPSITPSQAKYTSWIITLNNPTEEEKTSWKQIRLNHFVKEALGQIEVGENGTPHIQGYIRTDSVRFSQIKKLFPRAHIEGAKNAIAARQYCQKQETRVEDLPVTEINTSIHRAVYNETLKWFQVNLFDTAGNQVRWASPPTQEYANYIMLQQASWLEPETREYIYDRAVSGLIRSGLKHIEFIAVNQITRSAFIKYFPALIYRENAFQTKEVEQEELSSQSQDNS